MPQMGPLMWLILFLMVNLSLLFTCSLIYFHTRPNPVSLTSFSSEKYATTWKW